ncbi:MAG: hypothetical protein ACFE8M_12530 [Candidatus Hermodarchaeota archaeon]
MSKNPPFCYICGRSCEDHLNESYYCICDITICTDCIVSVKKNETTWICPHCHEERNIEKSRLFRNP